MASKKKRTRKKDDLPPATPADEFGRALHRAINTLDCLHDDVIAGILPEFDEEHADRLAYDCQQLADTATEIANALENIAYDLMRQRTQKAS